MTSNARPLNTLPGYTEAELFWLRVDTMREWLRKYRQHSEAFARRLESSPLFTAWFVNQCRPIEAHLLVEYSYDQLIVSEQEYKLCVYQHLQRYEISLSEGEITRKIADQKMPKACPTLNHA